MLANSLIMGLLTYTASVVYNLILRRSLENVFYLGFRFLIYTTLLTLFLQFSFYLIKNYNLKDQPDVEDKQIKKDKNNAETEAGEEIEAETLKNQDSAVNNEFENEEFSAFNPEEFDYQQDNNQ
ncbi:MAG: hypothetical protein ACOC27_02745 [Halanaerobium sp.]